MGNPISIVGFASNNRVPGFYGETVYGAGAISAASIPLILLMVGTKLTAGTSVPNQDVVNVLSVTDADNYLGQGAEIERMCLAGLKVPGVTIKAAPVAEAGGAVASTFVITFSGTWSIAGTYTCRFNGEVIQQVIAASDTPSTFAANLASTLNSDPRRPCTAANVSGTVTLSIKSKGARGNQYLFVQDVTQVPSGFVATTTGSAWVAATPYALNSFVVPTVANGFYYKATAIAGTGTSAPVTQPTWPTTLGSTVIDNPGANQITWTCWGQLLTGGVASFAQGTGTESVATLLGVLLPQQYDRICCAENDSTSLGLWLTQLNSQAGPTQNILQHWIGGVNSSLSAATTLATVTMNSQRMQLLWYLNGETYPAEMAAYFAALRTATEQTDPCAGYDDALLVNVAPQSQRADWPSNATLQSAVNNGLTAVYTSPTGSQALICRSVTTHTLSGATADYRTLDTSSAYVPDFVRRDIGLYWTTFFKVNNPRVGDDPPGDARPALSGIATPSTWNSAVEKKLRDYEKGILASGSAPTNPTVPPILLPGSVDTNKPSTTYDPVAKRLMTAIPVIDCPINHQVGVSVRQTASS